MAFESYVLVCGGTACCSSGGTDVVEAFKKELAAQGLAVAPFRPRKETAEAAGLAEWDELAWRTSFILSTEWLVVRDESLDLSAKLAKVRDWLAKSENDPKAKPFIVNIAHDYLRDKPQEAVLRALVEEFQA